MNKAIISLISGAEIVELTPAEEAAFIANQPALAAAAIQENEYEELAIERAKALQSVNETMLEGSTDPLAIAYIALRDAP